MLHTPYFGSLKYMASIVVNTRLLLSGKLEGIGFHTYEVLRRLVAKHPAVDFHFIFDRPYDKGFIFGSNVTPHIVFPQARHPLLNIWWYEFSIPRLLKKIKPNVFWSPDNFMSLQTSVPTVLTIHDLAYLHFSKGVPWREQKFYTHFTPKYIRKADHILAVSEYTKQDIVQQFRKAEEDITVCYNGCRDYFQPLDEQEKKTIREKYTNGKPYLVYLGSLHPRKNVKQLILGFDAFKKENNSSLQLVIAGRKAWMTADMDRALENSQYRNDIHLVDRYLEGPEAARLIGGAFALAYVSLFEGFGIPILEAMYSNVPVITSSVSSMPEVGGDAVLYVDPTSTPSIADAIQKLLDQKTYNQLLEKAEYQKTLFSWDKTANIVSGVLVRYL